MTDTTLMQLKARVQTVTDFAGVEEAADLAELIKAGQLPQRSPWAFVLPLGFDGGDAEVSANAYRQPLSPQFAVIIVVRALDDPKARKALPTVDALQAQLFAAVCGWAPDSAIGVFRALRGRLLSVNGGLVVYQITFALQDQLRILT